MGGNNPRNNPRKQNGASEDVLMGNTQASPAISGSMEKALDALYAEEPDHPQNEKGGIEGDEAFDDEEGYPLETLSEGVAPGQTGRSRPLSQKQVERRERAERLEKKASRKRLIRRIITTLVILVLCAIAVLLIAFSFFRWQTFDDAADIQGDWIIEGSDIPIKITEDKICFTEEVAYTYVLDPEAKTILFKFGNMSGSARYRFSLDRNELSIVDGEADGFANFFEDAIWTAQSMLAQVFGSALPSPSIDASAVVFLREGTTPERLAQGIPADADDNAVLQGDASDSDADSSSSDDATSGDATDDAADDATGAASSDNASITDQLMLPANDRSQE